MSPATLTASSGGGDGGGESVDGTQVTSSDAVSRALALFDAIDAAPSAQLGGDDAQLAAAEEDILGALLASVVSERSSSADTKANAEATRSGDVARAADSDAEEARKLRTRARHLLIGIIFDCCDTGNFQVLRRHIALLLALLAVSQQDQEKELSERAQLAGKEKKMKDWKSITNF